MIEPTRRCQPKRRMMPSRPAVFLHTGWRSAGTWLWSRFRDLPQVEAYYEPLNEALEHLTGDDIPLLYAKGWRSDHPALAHPYYHEYAPLLRHTGGVAQFHASFPMADFFADSTHKLPDLRAYIAMLLDHAARRGRQPVLKFCRSIGRVGWMRQAFADAVHVVVLRNPAAQFHSALRQFVRDGNPYFLVMPLAILMWNIGNQRVVDALRIFGVQLPKWRTNMKLLEAAIAATDQWRDAQAEQWYRAFLAFWTLCVLSIPDTIDCFIDADLLKISPGWRMAQQRYLTSLTGQPVTFGDIRRTLSLPNGIDVPDEVAWQCHQRVVMLLAAQFGAGWAETPIGARISAMLAHADLIAVKDQAALPTDGLDQATYLHRLQQRATDAAYRLNAAHAAHAWRVGSPFQWLNDLLVGATRPTAMT